jgi:hypothetical protein
MSLEAHAGAGSFVWLPPADPTAPVRTSDGQNPYTRLAQYGVKVEIPPVATPPSGPVIRNLLTMWSRVVTSK